MVSTLDTQQAQSNEGEVLLDEAVLDRYDKIRRGLLETLIATYLDEAPKYFAQIREGVTGDDFDEVYAGCHSLKSCSGNLGAVHLSRLCQDMETAATEKDKAKVDGYFEEIGPCAFETEEALKAKRVALQGKEELSA